MMVTLNPDGSTSREIIGSVAEGLDVYKRQFRGEKTQEETVCP